MENWGKMEVKVEVDGMLPLLQSVSLSPSVPAVHLEPDPYTAARSICSSLPLLLHQHRSITGAQSAAHCMSLQTLSGLLPALASRYINDDSSAPPHM